MNIQKINIEKLKAAEYNPRKDLKPEDEEYQKIKRSILEFGYVAPIIVNADMTVIGGHQRLKVLKELGYEEVECNIVDLDKTKEKALNIALNKITGEWDNSKLEELLAELKETDIDMDMTGFTFDEVDNILKDIEGSKEDDFDLDQALNEIEEPTTRPGDIWILGKNRLMCGDSTQKEQVMRLMDKQEADMLLTDPPYNVDYEGKTVDALKIENDNMTSTEFYNFLLDSFRNMFEVTKCGSSVYVFHADTEGLNFRNAFNAVGFKLAQCLVWVKNTFVMGRQDYQWRHEPILYGWKEGAGHYFINDRKQSTVLEFDKPTRNAEHPTMKPIDLLVYLIKNSSKENDLILDLFGGSGSTLIAAEQVKRRCYTMELDPKYCDVIVKRWELLTGEKAVLKK
ncbi:MAG: DNA modification methylase [Clostridia bacterium]|nr:DNA modification methylase [Clostridia bacterium]MBQ9314945.1 DNA modification methylase [Clostridia bacterium]